MRESKHFYFYLIILFGIFSRFSGVTITLSDQLNQKNAVDGLIKRLLGEKKAALFNVTILEKCIVCKDTFTLLKRDNLIHISGTSGVAASYGFHYYLKYYCNSHVSWDSDQLKIPEILPDVDLSITSLDKFRYYQNVVTYSYSFVWWTWERWEREIDWMALNGINIALAFTGQEKIWTDVYEKFNMTHPEMNEHFGGSAFLAWNRMGNIRKWGGPLTEHWHQNSLVLQHKILKRMRTFGIIPILPAFCGQVPRAFKRIFPNAKMKMLPAWAHFENEYCCPYLLDPEEPLFQVIGETFMRELVAEFGATNYYNCDTFNEMTNPFEDVHSLGKFSSAVLNAMLKVDDKATWVMQGWLFVDNETFWTKERVRDYLSGVPNDRMIILDLQSETSPQYIRLDSYFGKPFIWCMLHNFGGNLGMHGSFDILNQRILDARVMKNSTMVGTGLTPEGINQNYVIYDFMLESSWRNISVNTDSWIEKYSERRYGINDTRIKMAWIFLKNSVYNYKLPVRLHGAYILCLRPTLKRVPLIWYDVNDVLKAWDLLVSAAEIMNDGDLPSNYQYDLVDVSRQALQILFDQAYKTMRADYFRKDLESLEKSAKTLLTILKDLESVLATNTAFMLGPWLHSAKTMAASHSEKKSFEFYAKNQITLWGPNGEILDYGTKQWSGVVKDYYYPRWKLFCDYLSTSLRTRTKFNQRDFNLDVFKSVENPFCSNTVIYPTQPNNNTKQVVEIIHRKWRNTFSENVNQSSFSYLQEESATLPPAR